MVGHRHDAGLQVWPRIRDRALQVGGECCDAAAARQRIADQRNPAERRHVRASERAGQFRNRRRGARRAVCSRESTGRLPDRRSARSIRWRRPRCCYGPRWRTSPARSRPLAIRSPHGRRSQESRFPVQPAAPSLKPPAGPRSRIRNAARDENRAFTRKADRIAGRAKRPGVGNGYAIVLMQFTSSAIVEQAECRVAAAAGFRPARCRRPGRGSCRRG